MLLRTHYSGASCRKSLDGFIAGPNEGPGNGLGDDGHKLHAWLSGGEPAGPSGVPSGPSGVNGRVFDESLATGAVVAGRGTFEPAGGWGGDHHDGVPIFILSRDEPGIDIEGWPLVTYVNDVGTAMAEAKRASGEKNVLVHGAATAQLRLRCSPPSASASGSATLSGRWRLLVPSVS